MHYKAVYPYWDIPIRFNMPGCRLKVKIVAMATSLEELEKLVPIDDIQTNTFHLVKKSWKSV